MVTRFGRLGGVVIAAVVLAAQWPDATRTGTAVAAEAAADVTVHEWGTFTTVAGEDGRAVEWLPLGGPVDLPCFVYSFNRFGKIAVPFTGSVPDYTTARTTLKGTVRMETPVLYFYASQPTSVDVSVQFRKGLFSEWYPSAFVGLPRNYAPLARLGLAQTDVSGSISWRDVRIMPKPEAANAQNAAQKIDQGTAFPNDKQPSHYYAARATDASPIEVNGEREKFLFYRGVAGFDSPIDATLANDGTVTLANRSGADIPHVMLFSRHGARFGYRVHAGLAANQQVSLERPRTNRALDDVTRELEQTLVGQGLYVREARAMIETWRDSWFEDGTRVFYIVPPATVDAVLPLAVTPAPSSVVRVFVGRAELIDPIDIAIVAKALTTRDHPVLDRYGRLLGPIADRAIAKTASPAARADMTTQLNERLKSYAARIATCVAPLSATPTTTRDITSALPTLAALR